MKIKRNYLTKKEIEHTISRWSIKGMIQDKSQVYLTLKMFVSHNEININLFINKGISRLNVVHIYGSGIAVMNISLDDLKDLKKHELNMFEELRKHNKIKAKEKEEEILKIEKKLKFNKKISNTNFLNLQRLEKLNNLL